VPDLRRDLLVAGTRIQHRNGLIQPPPKAMQMHVGSTFLFRLFYDFILMAAEKLHRTAINVR